MALDLTVLSERLGDIWGGVNEANAFAGTTIAARADNIFDEYTSLAAQREAVDDLYETAIKVRADVSAWTQFLHGIAKTTLQLMCRDDTVRPVSDDVAGWIDKLNRDMTAAGASFTRPVVTATVAAGTNVGDGYLIASVTEPADGVVAYFAYAEVVHVECTTDSYSGGATAGEESFGAAGETPADDKLAYNWPKGSGATGSLTVRRADAATALLADGALDAWTLVSGSNYTPTSWTLLGSTTSGTHVNRDGGVVYAGTYSCKFTGDGSVVVGMSQALDPDVIEPDTNYALSFWYRTTSATYTAKLQVAFTNAGGTVVIDNAGTSQSNLTVDETALGAANGTWTRATMVLRTPRSLPAELRLEFRFPAGDVLDNAKSVYLDDVILSAMEPLYAGGPYLAVHAGATPFARGDKLTATVANNGGTTSFVRNFDRTFDLAAAGLRLVTASSATVNNNLIA